jgi:hypothetical protein
MISYMISCCEIAGWILSLCLRMIKLLDTKKIYDIMKTGVRARLKNANGEKHLND